MPIDYRSPHVAPEDPGGLIGQALEMGEGFPGPAEDLLLSWLLQLPGDRPPAEAARRIIDRHGLAEPERPASPREKLLRLLHDTARGSAASPGKPRRGRRLGRSRS